MYVCIYIFFPGIHIQYYAALNDTHLNIQKPAGNGSRSDGKEIIGSGMSLYKFLFLKIWVVRAFIVAVLKYLKIPTTSKILYLKKKKKLTLNYSKLPSLTTDCS